MNKKAQIAATIALIAGGIGMPLWIYSQTPSDRPNFRHVKSESELESTIKGTKNPARKAYKEEIQTIDYDKGVFVIDYQKSDKLPMPIRLKFDSEASYTALNTNLILPMQKNFRQDLGDRGFTAYEVLQILGKIDNYKLGGDIGMLTKAEVEDKIRDYAEKGKAAFNIDLEAPRFNLEAPRSKMLENSGTKGISNVFEAYEFEMQAVKDKWQAGIEKAKFAGELKSLYKQQYDREFQLGLARDTELQRRISDSQARRTIGYRHQNR